MHTCGDGVNYYEGNENSEGQMSKTLHVEPFSGIAGDMFVAALLDCGADVPAFWRALDSLPVRSEFEARTEAVSRSGIKARRFIVDVKHHHGHGGSHSHGRGLAEIESVITGANALTPRARELSLAIFRELAAAESREIGRAHV